MMKMSTLNRGVFISFEGIDGCGKSTQVRMLLNRLDEEGINSKLVREPGGSKISEEIRSILLKNHSEIMASRAEALLMTASRAQLTSQKIRPALEKGICVIADRYKDSTLAYQGGGRGIDLDWLIKVNHFATYEAEPDLTFYIDIDPEVGAKRRENLVSDRIESAGLDFQKDIRAKYLEIVDKFSERCVLVDGNLSIAEISQRIWRITKDRISIEKN